jgi:uncharacterized protein YaiL (DUF2058 family)
MSAKVDQFCDNLRDRLNRVEARLETAKTNIQALPGQAEKVVREKLGEVQQKLLAQKDRIDQTRANFKARAQQKLTETKEAIDQWKANHEARKLKARADRAEAYAVVAIEFAEFAIDEAEEAVFEAVVARIDAEAVQ